MGRKPSRARQYLYVYFALLIFFWGCSIASKNTAKPKESPAQSAIPEPEVKVETIPEPAVIIEPKEVRERREANERLQLAQNFLAKGDYEESLRESQKVLSLAREQSPADAAVFNMGLVFAHPKNPKKDNKRAIGFFNRVIKNYPESGLTEQAKIWVGVLTDVEKLKQVDIEIEEKKRDRTR
jgi:tetratricopeptide (TPR) repeat protein